MRPWRTSYDLHARKPKWQLVLHGIFGKKDMVSCIFEYVENLMAICVLYLMTLYAH